MKDPETSQPRFCDNCPMRGEVEGPLSGIAGGNMEFDDGGGKSYLGTWVVAHDSSANISRAIRLPNMRANEPLSSQAYVKLREKIEDCSAPDVERTRFLKRTKIVGCHALKSLSVEDAIDNPLFAEELEETLQRAVRLKVAYS